MPHKKPARSGGGRETPPERVFLKDEPIPKSAARVLNAQKIRDDYRKKRKLEESQRRDGASNKRRKQGIPAARSLVIQPGESLQHFSRRVEDDLRPLVKSAMQTASAIERNTATQKREARLTPSKSPAKRIGDTEKHTRNQDEPSPSAKEFATALPKGLNDVAQAPPEFKKFPRGASSFSSKKGDILSMSQRLLMEKERERVIQRYRELRAGQRLANDHQE